MSDSLFEAGTLKLSSEAVTFAPVKDDPNAEGRIPAAAIVRVRRKTLLAAWFWPVAATLSFELFAAVLFLSYLDPLTRAPLAQKLVAFAQRHGLDIAPYVGRFYDDHHLFLIALGFLALAALPALIAGLIRKNRLVLRLTVPSKPGVLEVTIAAGGERDALADALAKALPPR